MKKTHLLAFAAVAFAFASCGETKKEPATDPTPQIESTSAASDLSNPAHGEPGHVHDEPGSTISVSAEGMNPEHGQPGHRCDIPVGTPLSTPAGGNQNVVPTQTTSTSGSNQPFLVNDAAKAASNGASATSGNVNPPHGQPGHRCDIAVGSPMP